MNTVKKIKRRRKPMSVEQRIAATERLAKAREKRLKENPPQYKNIAKEVINLPDDHILCLKNIRKWIKTQKELLTVCLLYTSPSPRDSCASRMPSSA